MTLIVSELSEKTDFNNKVIFSDTNDLTTVGVICRILDGHLVGFILARNEEDQVEIWVADVPDAVEIELEGKPYYEGELLELRKQRCQYFADAAFILGPGAFAAELETITSVHQLESYFEDILKPF